MTYQRLNVAVLTHSAALSGAELSLLRLLPSVEAARVVLVLGEDGPLVEQARGAGLQVEVVPLARASGDLRRDALDARRLPLRAALGVLVHVVVLSRHLRRLGVDVVHTSSNKAHLYGGVAARLARRPHLWHAHDRTAPEFMPAAAVAVVRAAARWLPRLVVANSRSTLASLPGARTPRSTSPVLANPVDLEAFSVVLEQRRLRSATAATGEPAPELVVGMVGRLSPWKGQDLFLRAFAEAFGQDPAVRGVVLGSALFGEDEYARSLHELADELGLAGRVRFAGFVRDVPGALAELDVLVHASVIPEPFGQVVVEGMAAGLAVVASREGGPAEIVTDGVDGLLFTPRDVSSLAGALRRLRHDRDLRAALGGAAARRSADFAAAPIARQLEAVYDECAGGRRSRRSSR